MTHKRWYPSVDEVIGPSRVIAVLPECVLVRNGDRFVRMHMVLCECIHCGAISTVQPLTLQRRKHREAVSCKSCADRTTKTTAHLRSMPHGFADHARGGAHCPVCYDMPHRRPIDCACKCGGTYAPQVIRYGEVCQSVSPIALAAEG